MAHYFLLIVNVDLFCGLRTDCHFLLLTGWLVLEEQREFQGRELLPSGKYASIIVVGDLSDLTGAAKADSGGDGSDRNTTAGRNSSHH